VFGAHADAWHDLYWPYHLVASADSARPPAPCAVDGLGPALKACIKPQHELGSADVSSYYFRQWQGVVGSTETGLGNTGLHNGSLPCTVVKRVLRYRTGTLFTGTFAHKLNPHVTDACSLCGERDTGHHSVSSCPHLSDAVTSRHNAAGRIVLAAIRTGALGAYVVSADVGTLPGASAAGLPRRIPPSLTNAVPAPSVPDIVLHVPAAPRRGRLAARASKVVCVELKYCCDYRPAHQQAHAAAQHAATLALLELSGHAASLVTVLLGVSGTIYTSSLAALHEVLGLTKAQARAACSSLGRNAFVTLSSIYSLKRHLEPRPPPAEPP
jgi:hypothetical protein